MFESGIAFVLAVLLQGGAGAGEPVPAREPVTVPVHVRTEWVEIPATADDPEAKAPVLTRSALRILRAVDPATGKPYDASKDVFGCDPRKLRRSFRLEKRHVILGEPILVEFRIELEGSGVFGQTIGGNYRARGRDDNFLFLLRREDGTWVTDPYAPIETYMGGISSEVEVRRDKPLSYWLAVQRWCAVEEPGTYELHCFHAACDHELIGIAPAIRAALPDHLRKGHRYDDGGALIDEATGAPSTRWYIATSWNRTFGPEEDSPLLARIPEDVRGAMRSWMASQIADVAVFPISIGRYGGVVIDQMVKRWSNVASAPGGDVYPTGRQEAARQAIAFARQDDFLPLLAAWLRGADPNPYIAQGLAMRASPRAATILMERATSTTVGALYYARPVRIPDYIPWLIDLLTDPSDDIRSQAEDWLRRWTDRSFGHTWEPHYVRGRPTVEEGRTMRREWREWWQENRAGFSPKSR
ncbi:MAG: hypothetical protein JXP34_16670 [Planctomycetes bacterium]|nr:hypothetical protein [Planctomycetota bacterium]